jgi:cysteine desulfurase
MSKEVIYFDNNATTKIDDRALNLMMEIYKRPLNSSAAHQFGQAGEKYVNQAKRKISDLLNAENYQIIFNSGATESNNIALRSFIGYEIITCSMEHPSVLEVAKNLDAKMIGVDDQGLIKLDELESVLKSLDNKNFLVSVMLANNETGVIEPLKEIAKLVHQYGGLVHSDITQAFGKVEVDLESLNIDLASVSSHKIKGPQGVGALLVRNGIQINPLMHGGMQENGIRPGTTNIAGIAGFGEACLIAKEELNQYSDVASLRDYLENEIVKIAGADVTIFSKKSLRLPNTSFFATRGLSNQTLLMSLDLNNIAISIGSACSSGVSKLSNVLKAMGVDEEKSRQTIRLSLNKDNNKEEVNKFIELWATLYQQQLIT